MGPQAGVDMPPLGQQVHNEAHAAIERSPCGTTRASSLERFAFYVETAT